jgi:hypothetical protein
MFPAKLVEANRVSPIKERKTAALFKRRRLILFFIGMREENPKYEYRNPKQARISEREESSKRKAVSNSLLELPKDSRASIWLLFRALDFEFAFAPERRADFRRDSFGERPY